MYKHYKTSKQHDRFKIPGTKFLLYIEKEENHLPTKYCELGPVFFCQLFLVLVYLCFVAL